MLYKICLITFLLFVAAIGFANTLTIEMYALNKAQTYLGNLQTTDTRYGLLLVPHLQSLPPGTHGFHLREKPSCTDAGGHYDPHQTNQHLGPYNEQGHLGDLPLLYVNNKGIADVPELAPRLTVAHIQGHSVVIMAGGDTYTNEAEKFSGSQIACGIVK